MDKLKLRDLQYSVLMQTIAYGKQMIKDNEFIDPYDNEDGHTNVDLYTALTEAEMIIMKAYLK